MPLDEAREEPRRDMQGEDTTALESHNVRRSQGCHTAHDTSYCMYDTAQTARLRHGVPATLGAHSPTGSRGYRSTGTPLSPLDAISIQCTSYALNPGHPARETTSHFLLSDCRPAKESVATQLDCAGGQPR